MTFEQPPIEAAADVKEIEYVSALHQTGNELRRDGSITSTDVARYLISRHGIKVDPQYVEERIFRNGLCAWPSSSSTKASRSTLSSSVDNIICEEEGVPSEDQREEEQVLDLAELVATLLIPELIKASRAESGQEVLLEEWSEQDFESRLEYQEYVRRREVAESLRPPPDIIENVLGVILEETTGSFSSSEPRILDAELLSRILLTYGEKELAEDDDLMESMIAVACGAGDGGGEGGKQDSTVILDRHSFARALVGDVQENYRVEDDLDMTTFYYDVFKEERTNGCSNIRMPKTNLFPIRKSKSLRTPARASGEEEASVDSKFESDVNSVPVEPEEDPNVNLETTAPCITEATKSDSYPEELQKNQERNEGNDEEKVKMTFTFPTIDFTADTFRSKVVAVSLWTFFLVHLLASGSFGLQDFPQLVPNELAVCSGVDSILCATAEVILTWVNTVFTMTVVGGLVIVGIGSMGNSLVRTPLVFAIISLAPVIYFIVKAFTFGTSPSAYGDQIHRAYALCMSFVIGGVYLIIRMLNISYVYIIPKKVFRNCMRLERLFSGGQVHSEVCAKQAASYKTNLMIRNAYDVSCMTDDSERRGKPTIRSVFGFMKKEWETEKKGGYWWTWKSFFSNDLVTKEGIRVSSRLFAGNIIQTIIILYVILFVVYYTGDIVERYEELPTYIVVNTAGGAVNWVIGGLDSLQNSTVLLAVADGAIDLFYESLLPALDDLKLGSCNELFSVVNATQVEALCSASSLFSEVLSETCTSANDSTIDFLTSANGSMIDISMACSGYIALGDNTGIVVSTVCSGSNSSNPVADINATCFGPNSFFDFSGLPPAETMKSLVKISLGLSLGAFTAFLRRSFTSGVQYINDIWIAETPIQAWMIEMAFGVGGLLAFLAAIVLASAYFPSVVDTTLKFRSGVIPSLRDPNFAKYRTSVHWVTMIMGGMFWGTLIYCAGIVFIVAIVILVVCWIINNPFSNAGGGSSSFWGWIFGTTIAYVIQASLFALYGRISYQSFYRKRPAPANLFSLLWESSWLGLTIFVVILRLVKLIVVASLEVGRFDKPFLADGVGRVGPVNLDNFPDVFRKDILSHEAHLHPYIERLGKMYLTRLRYGERFASTPGSCWRIVFVLALMPWLRLYRMLAHPELLPRQKFLLDEAKTDDYRNESGLHS